MKASVILVIILVLVAGCSQSNSSLISPAPDTNPIITSGIAENALGILGGFSLQVDKSNLNADLIPHRKPAIGESYTVSGAGFFTVRPCLDCLKIRGVGLDIDGNLVIKMQVKHPFQKGDPFKPPTGLNRLDLDIFDLVERLGKAAPPEAFGLEG